MYNSVNTEYIPESHNKLCYMKIIDIFFHRNRLIHVFYVQKKGLVEQSFHIISKLSNSCIKLATKKNLNHNNNSLRD